MRLIESRPIKAPDVGQEGGEHADRDAAPAISQMPMPQTTSKPISVSNATVGVNRLQEWLSRSLTCRFLALAS